MSIIVYTDGACSNNGMSNAKAGIGIYFGENDLRNTSKRITGKQTNNTAELSAIIYVAKILKKEIEQQIPITIYSDSQYAIRCCTTYGKKLYTKNWKKGKKPIPNLILVKQAYLIYKDLATVQFVYIPAHTGKTDKHSVGNEGADRLANQAIGHESCMYQSFSSKIYLNVPYSEKDEAKVLGAKWDARRKKWYMCTNCQQKEVILQRWKKE